MPHRDLKDALYAQFARIGHAVVEPQAARAARSPGPGREDGRTARRAVGTPIKNTSAHLRVLRQARLVETRRDGTYVWYRLADEERGRASSVALQALGRHRSPRSGRSPTSTSTSRDELEPVTLRGASPPGP